MARPIGRDRPLLADLFCKAGGAAMGYHRAGFEVVGVDIEPQPHYPFEFHQADALTFPLDGFDAVHASPPCQRYSSMTSLRSATRRDGHPDLVAPVRERLRSSGCSWVIENVSGAPMPGALTLCGSMFGLRVRRHRLFESSVFMLRQSCHHALQSRPLVAVFGDHPENAYMFPARGRHTAKRASTIDEAREAMGIDWMSWGELTQAIPPAYTEWIGTQLLAALEVA